MTTTSHSDTATPQGASPAATFVPHLGLPSFLPGTPDGGRLEALRDRCERLFRGKVLREETLRGGGPVLAVICGGTNVGKSTVFNALVGEALSAASPLARGTKRPVLCGPGDAAEDLGRDGSLGGYRAVPWREAADALAPPAAPREILVRWVDRAPVAGVGLLDSPDMDSAYAPNRRVAEDLLFLADACLFVTTPEKYNDDVGVRFLADAARLRKAVVVVVNKSDEPEVLADVRDRVVPSAAPGAAARIVPVPPLPAEARGGGKWVEGVRKELRAAATDGARRAAAAGAIECFRQDFREVLRAAAAQAAALRELREAARTAARTEAVAYRREIEGGRFYELERVYRDVLAELRVPIVDDLYAGVGRFWRGVWALLPGAPPADALARRIAERRAVERDAAKAAARRAADAIERLPARFAERLGEAARACVPPGPAPEALSRALDGFLDEQEKVADAWVATRRRETLDSLKDHPQRTALILAVKGALQIGPGALAAFATGGLGASLLAFGVTERAMKLLLDGLGGRVYLAKLRAEFLDARGGAFVRFLEERVAGPVAGAMPEPPPAEAYAAAESALDTLGRAP